MGSYNPRTDEAHAQHKKLPMRVAVPRGVTCCAWASSAFELAYGQVVTSLHLCSFSPLLRGEPPHARCNPHPSLILAVWMQPTLVRCRSCSCWCTDDTVFVRVFCLRLLLRDACDTRWHWPTSPKR